MAMVPASSVLGESIHDRISPVGLMLRKPELEQRDSREYRKFRRHFRIPYEFLELVHLAKHLKWFSLAARDVAGRQCLPVVLLEDSQICCKFCQKCDVFGLGFEMTPTTDRKPYCTTVECTIL